MKSARPASRCAFVLGTLAFAFSCSASAQQAPASTSTPAVPAPTATPAPVPPGGPFLPKVDELRDPVWELARRPATFVQRPGDAVLLPAAGSSRTAARQRVELNNGTGAVTIRLAFAVIHAGKRLQIVAIGGGALSAPAAVPATSASATSPATVPARLIGADGTYAFAFQPPAGPGEFPLAIQLDGVRTMLRFVRP